MRAGPCWHSACCSAPSRIDPVVGYRIAMVGACPYPVPQGSQVYLKDTALALKRYGHEVRLVVYGHAFGPDSGGLTLHRGVRLPLVNRTAAGPSLVKPLLDLDLVFTLRCVVRNERIEIVHTHNYEALLVALAAGCRPIVYHAHNAMSDELPYFFPGSGLVGRAGAWIDRTFPRRADHTIVPHDRLGQYLVECGCETDRVTTVEPAADVGMFDPCETSHGTPPVLYAGNLDAYQNLDLLARAMKRVRRTVPTVEFLVATHQRRPVEGATIITIDSPAGLHRAMSIEAVFACPRVSWSGYPIKLLNAMSAAMAVVACESAAYPLTHEHDGLIVPDDDEAAFADALIRLIDDPELRRRLGRNARDTVTKRHRPEQTAQRISEVYARVMATVS